MVKMYFIILLTVLLTGLSFSYSEAAITIDSSSVLTDSQLEIMINNQKVNYFAVPCNNTLYVDRNLFSSVSMPGEEVFYVSGQNYYTCLPLFSTLDSYGVLYDYKKVYDKTIIIIITDPVLAQQYTTSASSTPPSTGTDTTENVTNEYYYDYDDDEISYPWGLGLAVAGTVHYLTDDDWDYIYHYDSVPDRFVWVGNDGALIRGDDGFILNNDNRFFVKGDDGFVNINKDGIFNNGNNYVNIDNNNVFYNQNGDNFGAFGNNVNNINIDNNNFSGNNINSLDVNNNNTVFGNNVNNINVDSGNFGNGGGGRKKIGRF